MEDFCCCGFGSMAAIFCYCFFVIIADHIFSAMVLWSPFLFGPMANVFCCLSLRLILFCHFGPIVNVFAVLGAHSSDMPFLQI